MDRERRSRAQVNDHLSRDYTRVLEFAQWAHQQGYDPNPSHASPATLEPYAEAFLRAPDAGIRPPPRQRLVCFFPG